MKVENLTTSYTLTTLDFTNQNINVELNEKQVKAILGEKKVE